MNSLSELNSVAAGAIAYLDTRTAQIVVSNTTPVNATVANVVPLQLVPGTNITSIVNGASFYNTFADEVTALSTTGLSYTVVLNQGGVIPTTSTAAAVLGGRVTWTTANAFSSNGYSISLGSSVGTGNILLHWSVNDSGGGNYNRITYVADGIKSVGDWNLVRSPWITAATGLITSTITGNNYSTTWYTSAGPIYSLSAANDATGYTVSGGSQQIGNVAYPAVLTGLPNYGDFVCNIAYTDSNAITSFTTGGTLGGTTVWDSTNQRLSLTGNVDQLNSKLAALYFTPATSYQYPIVLTYSLYEPNIGTTASAQQTLVAYNSTTHETFGNITRALDTYYTTPTSSANVAVTSTPRLITHTGGSVVISGYPVVFLSNSQTYELRCESASSAIQMVSVPYSSTTGGTVTILPNGSGGVAKLSISGNVAQINSYLAGNVQVKIAASSTSNYVLTWQLRQSTTLISQSVQNIVHTT